MVLMPLSGYLMTLYAARTINFFGIYTIPVLISKNGKIAGFFHDFHEYVSFVTLFLIVLHIGAAFKHHFIEKDNVLTRMLPFGK